MMKCIAVKHGMIIEAGNPLPFIVEVQAGYRRGGIMLKDDGKPVFMIGASNMTAEPTMNYKRRKDEEVDYLFGMVIQSPEEAEVLGEYFREIAEKMRNGELKKEFERKDE